jgi:phosphate transport system substrate-binding protein
MKTKTIGLLAAAAMTAWGSSGSAQTLVNGAGATFPYPMYSKWFNQYHKLHSDIQLNYQSIGSGGGIKQATEGTVDFGASDGPMTDAQLAEFTAKRGCRALHFPTVLGADVESPPS